MHTEPPNDLDAWIARFLRNATEHALVIVRPDGVIEAWLGAATRLFGYEESEAIGMDIGRLFTPEDRRMGLDRQEIRTAIAAGRSEDDRWHLRKDGSRFWGSGVLSALRDADGSVSRLVKLMRDRTDLRTQVVATQNRLAARERENERRSEYIVSIVHEMRNALAPMQNSATLIGMSDDETVRRRSLNVLQRQIDTLAKLFEDLSGASQPAPARFTLERHPVVVQDAIDQADAAVRTSVEQRGQVLACTYPLIRFAVDADPQRLQQMLLNLLGNAIKFTPPGGHITVSATIEGDMAVIRVTDNGMGIAPDVLPHIFELFTRDDARATAPGLGVGLAVVKELAAMHGGGIEARSPGVGMGSVFALRLPLAHTDPRPATPSANQPNTDGAP
ncbi:MAG: PAS domain-containing sensor histidine kinase [Burkholderiaceae bacterium]|nr:PAS domain-containing sensor histidine kinase [Burkholderiaceae bacterium]